jgi:predicted nucleotidyltransferase
MSLSDLLRPVDAIFKNCRSSYALIGGYAVAAWGEERATRDIDLFCMSDSTRIRNELRKENIQFEHRTGEWGDPIAEVIRIDMGDTTSPFEVDILFGIKDAPPGILNRVRIIDIEGVAIPVASPEDMVLLKLLGGSPRDLEDARSILQIQGHRLDWKLAKSLCPEKLKDSLEKLLEEDSCAIE